MPPRRPVTNLCLIAVFKQLTPSSQLKASNISPRCALLVRAANRRVKTLVLTSWGNLKMVRDNINSFSLAMTPSMQLLPVAGTGTAKPFPDYPVSLVDKAYWESLIALLKSSQWAAQLTRLMVCFHHSTTTAYDQNIIQRFFTAINALSTLQCLAIEWIDDIALPDSHYAGGNADLQIHLLSCNNESFLSVSEPFRSRVVRFGISAIDDPLPLVRQKFTSLTSLKLQVFPSEINDLFTALSQLPQLVHLMLRVDLSEITTQPRPLVQLTSVRALDLQLTISDHFQVHWLNLQQTLPDLQAIQLMQFGCTGCNVTLFNYKHRLYTEVLLPTISNAFKCLHVTLPQLHWSVNSEQIILGDCSPYPTLEQLLSSTKQ
ncbi:hypothetical protein TYRP_006808 [Tyrophagus putrescentiae]|nr:hypothetical protein TYRP_006808 [Tyrophagus putrescentiae]